jgi:3-hydroxymyristoyl/3-hydroxydecanoyl-(acyl carrier protein) dehydratase
MKLMWYELKKQKPSGAGELIADIRIPKESPWFSGHFPDHPVLPGIAQLEMVFDLIRQSRDHPIRLVAVSRVRFKQMIVPEDKLRVVASAKGDQNEAYSFRVLKADELVTSGAITIAGK